MVLPELNSRREVNGQWCPTARFSRQIPEPMARMAGKEIAQDHHFLLIALRNVPPEFLGHGSRCCCGANGEVQLRGREEMVWQFEKGEDIRKELLR